jgi:hypothetical protein
LQQNEILKKAMVVNIDQQADFSGDKIGLSGEGLRRKGDSDVCDRLIQQGIHHMPRPHPLPASPALSSVECPRCPHCQARMRLECIAPAPPGYDLRTFECAACDRISTRLVPSDPMKTGNAKRWLAGELKRPE